MAIRNIVKDGDPILKKVCRPVTDFNEKLATLLDDMGDTMLEANGLGLAGPQVGMMRRVFVVLDQYLDEDDNEVELRDLDEGEDDDVMHVDDLEKARQKQETEEAEKAEVSAEEK